MELDYYTGSEDTVEYAVGCLCLAQTPKCLADILQPRDKYFILQKNKGRKVNLYFSYVNAHTMRKGRIENIIDLTHYCFVSSLKVAPKS